MNKKRHKELMATTISVTSYQYPWKSRKIISTYQKSAVTSEMRVRAEYPFFSNLLLSRLNIHENAAKAGKVGIPGVSLSNTNTVDP